MASGLLSIIYKGVLGASLLIAQGSADDPSPPVWPGRFHATIFQNRFEDLGVTHLWYDFALGRNLNVIQTQSGEEDGPLFDNERANGTGYYYLPAKSKSTYCNIIDFGVGILKPDWLAGATYLGAETVGIYNCYKWEQGEIPSAHARSLGLRTEDAVGPNPWTPNIRSGESLSSQRDAVQWEGDGRFITYWSEKGSDRPVKWIFFDGAEFEVIRFDPGATMDDDLFQIPDYCFSEEEAVHDETTSPL